MNVRARGKPTATQFSTILTPTHQRVGYIQQMKLPYLPCLIKGRCLVVPGEGSYVNNEDHLAVNPAHRRHPINGGPPSSVRNGKARVLPDFPHLSFYWQYTTAGWTYYDQSPDSDPLLLQVAGNPCPSTWSDWNSAATNLRQQNHGLLGSAGTNIELCVTENNKRAGEMGPAIHQPVTRSTWLTAPASL